MNINSRTIKALLAIAIIILSSVPLASSESASTSVSVQNAKPLFVRYWIDEQGPVEYVSDGSFSGDTQNGAFYFMKDLSGYPIPYNPAYKDNPNRYIIDIEPPADTYRDVEIRVELQDANGWDDLIGSEVNALLNTDTLANPAPPAIALAYESSPSVDTAIYKGTFRLYKETAAGRWIIKFQFRDIAKGTGWYNTNLGGFYDHEYIAISLYDAISSEPASTFSFGSIDPGTDGISTMYVQNDGNTNLGIVVSPEDMFGTVSQDILDPETSEAWNSNDISTGTGTVNLDGTGYFSVEQPTPIDWSTFIYHRGKAIYGVNVPTGTKGDTYSGVITVAPQAQP